MSARGRIALVGLAATVATVLGAFAAPAQAVDPPCYHGPGSTGLQCGWNWGGSGGGKG